MTGKQFGRGGWTADSLPDLNGKTYVITGANSGIGFEAARMLGEKGAACVMLCRNPAKADEAKTALEKAAPQGRFAVTQMDLADLSSVRAAAGAVGAAHPKIDGLLNNAGIMMPPKRELTKDGFELQFGVNHLGHFLLSALLAKNVEAANGRFVSVASIAHKFAPKFRFDDITFENGYSPGRSYAHSKLANLSFALELNRRLEAAGKKARAFACHPGYSETNLQSTGPGAISAAVMKPLTFAFSQTAEKGALPTVLCAAGEAEPGGYYGPTGLLDMTGPVDRARYTRRAKDADDAKRLWDLSVSQTGAEWTVL